MVHQVSFSSAANGRRSSRCDTVHTTKRYVVAVSINQMQKMRYFFDLVVAANVRQCPIARGSDRRHCIEEAFPRDFLLLLTCKTSLVLVEAIRILSSRHCITNEKIVASMQFSLNNYNIVFGKVSYGLTRSYRRYRARYRKSQCTKTLLVGKTGTTPQLLGCLFTPLVNAPFRPESIFVN